VVACILVTGLLTFLLLRAAGMLDRVMGRTGLNILKRLMGLILASVAVQFVVNGIVDVVRIAERG
jgi:multiple antibiotic resistance protein